MSHADTIRRNLYGTLPSQDPLIPDQRAALHALDALLVERQQLRDVEQAARQLIRRDITDLKVIALMEANLIAALAAVRAEERP
jgi:hypothetical protein